MRFAPRLALLCLLSLATSLLADDFSDFRIPKHRLYNVTGSATGAFFNTRYRDRSYYYSPPSPLSLRLNDLEGELNGAGQWLFDSDSLRTNIIATLDLSGRHHEDGKTVGDTLPQSTSNRNSSYLSASASISGDLRYYPWSAPVGFFTMFSMETSTYDDRDHRVSDNYTRASHMQDDLRLHDESLDVHAVLDVGWGLGRVRDVTAVYDIQVLEERLSQIGMLRTRLSSATRRHLMELFYLRGYYDTVHDRADKFFWRDVEALLQADSALKSAPDAYVLYRIAEGYLTPAAADSDTSRFFPGEQATRFNLNRARLFRQRGFFGGVIVEGKARAEYYRSRDRNHSEQNQYGQPPSGYDYDDVYDDWCGSGDVWVGGRVEYHRPFGARWQVDVVSSALTPLFEEGGGHDGVNVQNELNTTFLIMDRWRADLTLRHRRYLYADESADYWKTTVSLGLRYYIEDHLSLTVSGAQTQGMRTMLGQEPSSMYYLGSYPPAVFPPYPEYQRVYQINVGLSYHILGSLDTFGLVPQGSSAR